MQNKLIFLIWAILTFEVESLNLRTFESAVDPKSITETEGIDIIKILNLEKNEDTNLETEKEESEILKHKMKKSDIDNFANYLNSYLKLLRHFNNSPKKSSEIYKSTRQDRPNINNNFDHNTRKFFSSDISLNKINLTKNQTTSSIKAINTNTTNMNISKMKENFSNNCINSTRSNSMKIIENFTYIPENIISMQINKSINDSNFNESECIDKFLLSTQPDNSSIHLINNSNNSYNSPCNITANISVLIEVKNNKTNSPNNRKLNHLNTTNLNITRISVNNFNTNVPNAMLFNRSIITENSKTLVQAKFPLANKISSELTPNVNFLKLKKNSDGRLVKRETLKLKTKDNLQISADDIENNIYKRIINISIPLILIGLLLGIFLGLILVMYFNSKNNK